MESGEGLKIFFDLDPLEQGVDFGEDLTTVGVIKLRGVLLTLAFGRDDWFELQRIFALMVLVYNA